MSHIDGNELVYYTDNNNVYSGGFNVNSIIKKQGGSPIMTLNNPGQSGGNVSDIFNNLAVPNWALSYSFLGGKDREAEENEVISEDLHEKLLSMIRVNEKKEKPKTKKRVRISNKKSKKCKNGI
jgi:hypothetical protein